MVLLNSDNIPVGTPAPDFNLPCAITGKNHSLSSFADKKVLVVMFLCVHCPYVQAIENRIVELRKELEGRSVQFIGICSNDAADYPEDRPENLKKRAEEKGYGFPYLVDESQEIARAYKAVCTPEIYVLDESRKLAYHGRLDDNWKDASRVTKQDLKQAIEALLQDKTLPSPQIPSMGCSIKWKK